ncbi:TRAP transporter large permease [Hydrogenophaga sp.]|jgi:C4-dicarboxylate transporter DctM subunit|uniref:TRAP transporter large permease n=1 Tax=Hydrogenophaga sp. TaxID=1904254 RepID=UPI003F6FE3CA
MSPEWQIIVVFALFLALLAVGVSIPFAIAAPGIVYLMMLGGLDALKGLGLVSWGSMNSFILTAIPLFLLMAELMQESGMTLRVYRGLSRLVSRVPGGLLQTNIAGCALFGAMSSSSVATASSIGSVALPQLIQRGYDRPLAAGSLAAGGTLGILLPPSLVMIIYASFTETSVSQLFMAGVVPGLLLTAMFMAYIAVRAITKPEIAPVEQGVLDARELWTALVDIFPVVILILLTMGSLYAGIVTPTEAAALGCVLVLVLAAFMKQLSWKVIRAATTRTAKASGNILFIVFAAYVFSYAISVGGVGEHFTAFLVDLNLSRLEFFLALFVLYTVMGCLVEGLGMIVITVPLLYPVLQSYGVDPVWFGIVLVLFIELGAISPPIGINLFVIQSIWDGKFIDVVMGTIPFHILMFVLLGMLVMWPEIALWLPQQMLR